ncbi:MAG TPA: diacylglycerol kinase family protein [Thermoguttaceae bacterium]|nr:diacylglycerol kinase family protein [Thermoguttaceae bacterium]
MPPDASSLPAEADEVLLAVNPKAGARSAGARVQRLVDMLEAEGYQARVLDDLDQIAQAANQSHAQGRLRALIGVGGDGTAAELVNRTRPGTPITLLPAGNENLLARHLGLDRDPASIFQAVKDGIVCKLDAARADERIFLLMIGCGFDGEVVRRVHQRRTGHIRSRNYAKPILQTIRSYQYPQMRVYWGRQAEDGQPEAGQPEPAGDATEVASPLEARWLFAFNVPCYGGGMQLAPQADPGDGLLDVCAFGGGSWWHALRYVTATYLHRHERLADCTTCRTDRLRITSDAQVPYQLDGDPGGSLPVDVEALPGRLTMIVPATKTNGDETH